MASYVYTGANESNLMKIKYEKLIKKQFNTANPLFGRMKQKENSKFVGKQLDISIKQSIGGGVGSGSLPTANTNKIGLATITSKKVYGVTSIDRESKKAMSKDEGSFIRATADRVETLTQSFNRNLERMLTRNEEDGEGALLIGNASNSNVSGAGTSGCPYVISLDVASTYFPAEIECIEEGDFLNVNTETTPLEVTEVSVTDAAGYVTATISLVGTSVRLAALTGSGPFAAADSLYMQNSKDSEMVGLQGVLSATSGSIYGVTVGRRWKSFQKDASGSALSTDLMNEVVINVKRQCGKAPNLILISYHQMIKLLNLFEDHKRYNVPVRDKKLAAQMSFSAIEYISPDGVIPVVASRFIDSDKIFFLNDNHLELHLRPGGFEWFDDDGVVFLRETTDSYEARYGGYGEFYINPHFQGYLHNLAV